MLTSVRWLNRYLDPATLTPEEAEHVLTHVGFPVESREELPSGDTRLDVELTSNRGDCLSHVGLAREAAAATGRRLVMPALKSAPAGGPGGPGGQAGLAKPGAELAAATSVENQLAESGGCPRFTARLIRGVKVGPSPAWLVEALESVGLRSINNVVDVTNYVNLELGHPCHVFDLDALAGKRLIVRHARAGETVVALDGRTHRLGPDEMVVADAEKAVSIAGVIGGLHSGVTEKTTSVLFEMATWDPIAVRRAARRLDIRTDASHRFERYVDGRDIDFAAQRAAELIVELAGGALLDGMIDASAPIKPRSVVFLRSGRCHHVLGVKIATPDMIRLLGSIGVEVSIERHGSEERLKCVVPPHRHDLTREIDLIEELGRLNGFDKIKVAPALDVHLELSHPQDWARREKAMDRLSAVLTGAGFFETVTFSFLTKEHASMFLPAGLRLLMVDEQRRPGSPYLRPSVLPSLLTCRRANQDGQVRGEGSLGVRLFECASTFAEQDDGKAFARTTVERRVLSLLIDAPAGASQSAGAQESLRQLRGVIESVARAMGGAAVRVELEPMASAAVPALEGETQATVKINGSACGFISTVGGATLRAWGLERPVAAAEIDLRTLIELYPPRATAHALPRFPSIERDLSVVVDESVAWSRFERTIAGLRPPLMEELEFVTVYRGKPVPAGKKSVTLRLTFRDPERTLRHEEVDPQIASVVAALGKDVGGELRV